MENECLIPWYALDPDADRQTVFNRPQSAARIFKPEIMPKSKPNPNPTADISPRKVYRPADVVFMELTYRIRKDLQNEIRFEWPDDVYKKLVTSWYEEQKAKGIQDIVFLCGSSAEAATGRYLDCCTVCWYSDGSVTAFEPSTDIHGGKSEPVIKVVRVLKSDYAKPEFQDNAYSFKKALQSIAEYADFEWWKNRFQEGLSIMNREHVTYCGQENTFFIPEPYFKYLLAAQVTRLGMGMGSWYDLPTTGTTDHKYYTNLFTIERDKALMYAVNNC